MQPGDMPTYGEIALLVMALAIFVVSTVLLIVVATKLPRRDHHDRD